MAFFRTRTDKHGNQYRYLEERWREGKKVKSRSTYMGRTGGDDVDRSVVGHSSEVEDMMQGYQMQEAQKASAAPAPEAPAAEPLATDAAPEATAEGQAEGDGI